MLTSVRLAVLILIISAAAAMPRKQLRLARHLQAGDEPALVAATDDVSLPHLDLRLQLRFALAHLSHHSLWPVKGSHTR